MQRKQRSGDAQNIESQEKAAFALHYRLTKHKPTYYTVVLFL